jgi:hypothetical protein
MQYLKKVRLSKAKDLMVQESLKAYLAADKGDVKALPSAAWNSNATLGKPCRDGAGVTSHMTLCPS